MPRRQGDRRYDTGLMLWEETDGSVVTWRLRSGRSPRTWPSPRRLAELDPGNAEWQRDAERARQKIIRFDG